MTDSSGNIEYTLAKVRNPWANEHYTGPWSDGSDMWNDDYKAQLGYENSNDGAFWLDYDDYLKHFFVTDVAIYQPYKYK